LIAPTTWSSQRSAKPAPTTLATQRERKAAEQSTCWRPCRKCRRHVTPQYRRRCRRLSCGRSDRRQPGAAFDEPPRWEPRCLSSIGASSTSSETAFRGGVSFSPTSRGA
jgi:hypothetical protein